MADINATGNYSVTPQKFYIKPPAGELWVINRMVVYIQDGGAWRSEYYAGLGAPLTNGIDLYRNIASDSSDHLITTKPVTHNSEWGQYNYDVDIQAIGAGDITLLARWTFEKSGRAMALDGSIGEELGLIFRDDLSGIVEHHFHVQGFKVK